MKQIFFLLLLVSSLFSQVPQDATTVEKPKKTFNQKHAKDLSEMIHYSEKNTNIVGYLSLDASHLIDKSTYIYFRFAIEYFRQKRPICLLININSKGGEIVKAQAISQMLIENDLSGQIPSIAYINNEALASAALIALSCRFIMVNPFSKLGSVESIWHSDGYITNPSSKLTDAIREDFRNTAALFSRNPAIAETMVDSRLVLVNRDGEIKAIAKDQLQMGDEIIEKNRALTLLDSQQMMSYNIAAIHMDSKTPIQPPLEIFAALKQLPFFDHVPALSIEEYRDWKVSFFSFISNHIVLAILLFLVIIGFYIEFVTPGFGIAGSVATVSLALILLSSFSIYPINWLEPITFVLGAVLLIYAGFFSKKFGIVGFIGTALASIGLFAIMMPSFDNIKISFTEGTVNLDAYVVFHTFIWVFITFVISYICVYLLHRFVIKKKRYREKFFWQKNPFVSGISLTRKNNQLLPLPGTEAVAISPLTPGGKILIGKEVFEAYAEDASIGSGEKVIIIRTERGKLIVRAIQ